MHRQVREGEGGPFVLALDSGTTSVRAILFDQKGRPVAQASQPIEQHYPQPGWVEHDATEILAKQASVISEVQYASGIHSDCIAAVGITNQRETTVVWDRATGEPVGNAICWQCRRTEPAIADLVRCGLAGTVRHKTGLVPDPYFSATKIAWILENVPGARARAEAGDLLFGTIDSWLIWNFTGGEVHATDRTNASRTMLYNIRSMEWDAELLDLFHIPPSMLPQVLPSTADYGRVNAELMSARPPICGVAGDQQASLFGHCCFDAGDIKATYGTGCFLLMNTGTDLVDSHNGLLSTVAATASGSVEYALEGSVFNAGSVVQWLRDELGIIQSPQQTEELALSVPNTGGVYMVPAFTGLGAPWWDAQARGVICGLTRGTGRAELVRAALESIAYQALDVIDAMCMDAHCALSHLAVDGGGSHNRFTMQWQADLLGCPVTRPFTSETTALGAAYLAGMGAGVWNSLEDLKAHRSDETTFKPTMTQEERAAYLDGWHQALGCCRTHPAGEKPLD